MYKVLVTILEHIDKSLDVLSILEKENCEVVKSPYPHPVGEKDLLKIIPEMDAIITGSDEITRRVIQAARKLKVISKYGVGVEKIDVAAATSKRIVVAYASNQSAVADLTIGLMFCLCRRICEANASVKAGEWRRPLVGVETWQKTLGVVGAGRVGQTVIKRVKGFEMEVLVYDVYRNEKIAKELGFEYTSLERLLKESDLVTIHVPLNNKTRGLIGEKEMRLMKPSAYLINTARGGIINETALYEALEEKRLAGAALDTHTQEPPPEDAPLLKLNNVIVTPHIGSDSRETLSKMSSVAVENILRVLKGEKPLYALNFPFA